MISSNLSKDDREWTKDPKTAKYTMDQKAKCFAKITVWRISISCEQANSNEWPKKCNIDKVLKCCFQAVSCHFELSLMLSSTPMSISATTSTNFVLASASPRVRKLSTTGLVSDNARQWSDVYLLLWSVYYVFEGVYSVFGSVHSVLWYVWQLT